MPSHAATIIGKMERVRDGLEALPFDDLAHGLGHGRTRASLVCCKKASQVGRASWGKCSLRGCMVRVFRKNYDKNSLRHVESLIGTKPFSSISLELLKVYAAKES